ncbi:hypothetical protein ACE6ED_06035 [Paenibacillus sp. CN-4]|uniref:hypothetical protein n=1 Tax=Paenibacillus nanchangensis TaxID=3348343 RepID=UPI00397AF7E3
MMVDGEEQGRARNSKGQQRRARKSKEEQGRARKSKEEQGRAGTALRKTDIRNRGIIRKVL